MTPLGMSDWPGHESTAAGRRPSLTIWQFDQHPTLAGEAKTMLVRFADSIGVDTKFVGNSLANPVCDNYGLCPQEHGLQEIIEGYLSRYYKDGHPFHAVEAPFARALAPRIAPADVVMCGQPLVWTSRPSCTPGSRSCST